MALKLCRTYHTQEHFRHQVMDDSQSGEEVHTFYLHQLYKLEAIHCVTRREMDSVIHAVVVEVSFALHQMKLADSIQESQCVLPYPSCCFVHIVTDPCILVLKVFKVEFHFFHFFPSSLFLQSAFFTVKYTMLGVIN